jgi:hypothetical protein
MLPEHRESAGATEHIICASQQTQNGQILLAILFCLSAISTENYNVVTINCS